MAKRKRKQNPEREGVESRKNWGWLGEWGERAIEATSEWPLMYIALGSEPKTEHPFNLYRDIMSIPQALRDTLKTVPEQVSEVADEILRRNLNRIISLGLGTSQFVAIGVSSALGNFGAWDCLLYTSDAADE